MLLEQPGTFFVVWAFRGFVSGLASPVATLDSFARVYG